MRKLPGLLLALAIVAVVPAAQAAEPTIAPGVSIGGIAVGGMTRAAAAAAVRSAYEGVPLQVFVDGRRFHYRPSRFGLVVSMHGALTSAFAASGAADFPVSVRFSSARVRTSAEYAADATQLVARDAAWRFHGHRPYVVSEKSGLRAPTAAIRTALRAQLRKPSLRSSGAAVARVVVEPAITTRTVGPAILINRGANELRYYRYRNHRVERRRVFRVATGQPAYPTPAGTFRVIVKDRNPWWIPPNSPWAQGEKPIPPGPGNPLGTRWMGLSAPGVGIHGTPDAASIGYSASHGCIRMHIPDAEWLFERVRVGTPVKIL